jgi:Na+:H+ antiporter, NhaA family
LRARARVDADVESAEASGVVITPTFFINDRRYDGPWDITSFAEALVGTLGHRLRTAALDFTDWAPSAGILLLGATILALVLTNSALGFGFLAFWEHHFGLTSGGVAFEMSLLHWISDGLLTIFFLVVGLEIKREFTVGHLANWRSAALPVAAAIGGILVPAILYLALVREGPWIRGWGVPTATDTAFAVSLLVMMGSRVPKSLRVFLTTAAIVDDIGAIIVVAVFYSGTLDLRYVAVAIAVIGALALLNRARVYRAAPYLFFGVLLWAAMYASGLHPTMAGAILAFFIPTRPPANLRALMAQADAILISESNRDGDQLRLGPSLPALRALDTIHDRLESPADRMLRYIDIPSTYIVLPLFALANAGVAVTMDAIHGHGTLMVAIMAGLMLGKPLGLISASRLAVWLGIAVKPNDYSWRQLVGAGTLAGIGFTISLFIANQAFPDPGDFSAAKIAILTASTLSAVIGAAILWIAGEPKWVSTSLLAEM